MLQLLLLTKTGGLSRVRSFPCANDRAILPVGFIQQASRAARLWCYARSIDHPTNGGEGRGVVEVLFSELQSALNRSERSIYRYLRDARDKGYIHSYRVKRDWVRIRYCALERIASRLGMEELGVIATFPLVDIEFSKIRCTEAQALSLQNQSWHEMRKEWGRLGRDTAKPTKILTSDKAAGGAVIARGKRLVYLRSHQRKFGGSQQTIANRLGISLRTVQYRLSATWREARGLEIADKAQAARQVCEEYPLEMLRDFYDFTPEASAKLVFMGKRLFEVGTNIYQFPAVELRSQKYRKSRYLRKIGVIPVAFATSTEIESRREGIRRDVKMLLEEIKSACN